MGMGFAPTWLRQVSPPPASQNHFNHCRYTYMYTDPDPQFCGSGTEIDPECLGFFRRADLATLEAGASGTDLWGEFGDVPDIL